VILFYPMSERAAAVPLQPTKGIKKQKLPRPRVF
jgi:hypothetical protein